MEQVLTQHEIDKLFQQMQGNKGGAVAAPTPSYYKYDFRSEQKIGAERKRSLQALHGFFMRLANSTFTTQLRSSPVMSLAAVNQLSYGEYVEAAPTPGCFYTVTAEELEEDFLLDLALPIAYTVVDRLLGGQGETAKINQRELSEIEQTVVGRFMESLVEDFQKAWSKFKPIHLKIKSSAGDPQFVQLIAPTEAVIIVSIAVRLLDINDFLNLVFPVSMLERGLPKANVAHFRSVHRKEDSQRDARVVRRQMIEVPVQVVARLGSLPLSFEDLMTLEPGDVLTLDRLIHEPIDLIVGGEEKFRGFPGLHRGHRAVKISVDNGESENDEEAPLPKKSEAGTED